MVFTFLYGTHLFSFSGSWALRRSVLYLHKVIFQKSPENGGFSRKPKILSLFIWRAPCCKGCAWCNNWDDLYTSVITFPTTFFPPHLSVGTWYTKSLVNGSGCILCIFRSRARLSRVYRYSLILKCNLHLYYDQSSQAKACRSIGFIGCSVECGWIFAMKELSYLLLVTRGSVWVERAQKHHFELTPFPKTLW